MNVSILMATYNGEKFIHEQLDSVLTQSYKDFNLYISDDGSSDSTVKIIREYSKKDSRIILLDKQIPTGSACKNFLFLLSKVEGDVFLFCDQDDVWENNHVELLINNYLKIENRDDKPILIHSDLKIVDEKMNIIDNSGFHYMKLPHKKMNKHFYFVQNNVTGCVTLINKVLRSFVLKNTEYLSENIKKILMHDIFFANIASEFGSLITIKEPLELYRQHQSNVLGAVNARSLRLLIHKLFTFKDYKKSYEYYKDMLQRYKDYACFFIEYFETELDKKEYGILKKFSTIDKYNKIYRIFFLIKNKFLKYGFLRNMWLFIVV